MGKKVQNYTLEFKQSTANLAVSSDKPISQTAKEFGIAASTLSEWVKRYATTDEKHTNQNISPEAKELIALRKELKNIKEERDILKKAMAYFSRDTL